MKYPHLVDGAIASSAPILQFTNITGPKVFNNIVTQDFKNANANCASSIQKSWGIMSNMNTTDELLQLSQIFSLCSPLQTSDEIVSKLFAFISNAYSYMSMADYPYPTTFLGPMPGYPVKEACKYFSNNMADLQILTAVKSAISIYYNYSGQAQWCFNTSSNEPSTLSDLGGWDYQSCTEMVMPIGQYGEGSDMFWSMPWDLNSFIHNCSIKYNVIPRPDWIATYYGESLIGASNIVFSNGDLDPWSGGGVLATSNSVSGSIVTIMITGGAHHLDLRAANSLDPQSVISARNQEKQLIYQWIDQHFSPPGSSSSGLATKFVILITIVVTLGSAGILMGVYLLCTRRKTDDAAYTSANND